jgi:toxin-antitoxin system PIN domain toxin
MNRVALLDVNVLIALFDPDHVHHDPAHDWFEDSRTAGWATCPLTENALVRILANPAYVEGAESTAQMVKRLRRFCGSGGHVFWGDTLSVRDRLRFPATFPVSARQITDTYLLALASANHGTLATFDGSIALATVVGATPDHLTLIRA